eukprot:51367-Rhodomonas_salina.3
MGQMGHGAHARRPARSCSTAPHASAAVSCRGFVPHCPRASPASFPSALQPHTLCQYRTWRSKRVGR